jgi:hypothetical protein
VANIPDALDKHAPERRELDSQGRRGGVERGANQKRTEAPLCEALGLQEDGR